MGGKFLGAVVSVAKINFKRSADGFFDQYNRMFMSKMCMILSAIIGCNYFNDQVSCIVTNAAGMGGGFVGSVCWIQGLYIYKELRDRLSDCAYFGLPRNMDYDGINSLGNLCSTTDRGSDIVSSCQPMEKQYYLQYQYLPFLTSAYALMYYLPYLLFKTTNNDMAALQDELEKDTVSADNVVTSYFNYEINSKRRLNLRCYARTFVRILYLVVNIVVFYATDIVLNGNFRNYGSETLRWSSLSNQNSHDHNLKVRTEAKPGNVLMPTMGYCDVTEGSRDVRNTRINYHKILCEISPHVLYQYALLPFWFLVWIGIIVTITGLITRLFGRFAKRLCSFATGVDEEEGEHELHSRITPREEDYLELIKTTNATLYKEVVKNLINARPTSETQEFI